MYYWYWKIHYHGWGQEGGECVDGFNNFKINELFDLSNFKILNTLTRYSVINSNTSK